MGTDDRATSTGEAEVTSTTGEAPPAPTESMVREVASEAVAHVRTVERRMLGLSVRGRVGERIDAALARRGLVTRGLGR